MHYTALDILLKTALVHYSDYTALDILLKKARDNLSRCVKFECPRPDWRPRDSGAVPPFKQDILLQPELAVLHRDSLLEFRIVVAAWKGTAKEHLFGGNGANKPQE